MEIFTTDKPDAATEGIYNTAFTNFQAYVVATTAAAPKGTQLYRTDADDLFNLYLAQFKHDPVQRQYLNCSCCRRFLKEFGSLVWIDAQGAAQSFAFGLTYSANLSREYVAVVDVLRTRVMRAKILRPFHSRNTIFGLATSGGHDHLFARNPKVYSDRVKTPGQRAAEQAVAFTSLLRLLREIPTAVMDRASALIATANLHSNAFAALARTLADLSRRIDGQPQPLRDPIVWKAIEQHGDGLSHVRGGAVGFLVGLLNNGTQDADAMRQFRAMVDPMSYQRSTSGPKAGNVARAEDLVAKLGLAPALERRVAHMGEVAGVIWWPSSVPGAEGPAPRIDKPGVFAALNPTAAQAPVVAGKAMTWENFSRKILPVATCIELMETGENTFGCVTAAVNPDAPPIFQWDEEGRRNPMSWYRWNAISAADFNVRPVHAVSRIVTLPCAWGRSGQPLHDGVILLMHGAMDTKLAQAGTGLYAPLLKSDLKEVRATLFAHSARSVLSPSADPAAGLVLRRGFTRATLRVTVGGVATVYQIRDWD